MSCRLSDIATYVNERVSISKLTLKTYVSTENMIPNKGGITVSSGLPAISTTQAFKQGDVLVSNIRPYFKKIWVAEYDGGCSNDVLVFRPKEGIASSEFLYLVLSDDAFFDYMMAGSKGTKMPRGDRKAIIDYPISDFAISHQDQITRILLPLNRKIHVNAKLNDNLEQQAQLLIQQYGEATTNRVCLHDIMDFDNGFPFQSKTYLDYGKYKIITIKNVTDGKIDTTDTAFIDDIPPKMKPFCELEIGDVLLSLTGNVGRVGIVCESNLLLNQRVAKIKPRDTKLLPFLYFVFRQPSTKEKMILLARGTAQANLSPIETLKMRIPFQEETAICLSSILSPLFNQIMQNNKESKVLAELRDYLLPLLLSGQISIGD